MSVLRKLIIPEILHVTEMTAHLRQLDVGYGCCFQIPAFQGVPRQNAAKKLKLR